MRKNKTKLRFGAAAVEFAISLPLLMAVFMGVLESGRLMSALEIVVNAAREGAPLAVLGGSTIGTSTSTGSSEVNYRVREYFNSGGLSTSSATITVTDLDNSTITDLPQASTGDRIQVTVSVPFASVAWCTPWFFGSAKLTATSVMRKESPCCRLGVLRSYSQN
jgi:Flp pilus assembly protein TadG